MKIAVLSGKGGTGKTFVSVNLAAVSPNAVYLDCDVEAPNGHLFFNPVVNKTFDVMKPLPVWVAERCLGCRSCVEFCKFNAMAAVKDRIMIFDTICHACGGCVTFCKGQALYEKDHVVGKVQMGFSEDVLVYTGTLNIGEASGVPIIQAMVKNVATEAAETLVVDCPPGSACVVMESIKAVDYCLLIAEPTQFGAHNLALVYDLAKAFHKPMGVVLNKCVEGDNPSKDFCLEKNIPVLEAFPFDEALGQFTGVVTRAYPEYRRRFQAIYQSIEKVVKHETTVGA